ncbi:MAG: NUDIX domain-containing protein, partial [Desulfovibrionales bacterium]|nr:NUDIX domain-containing protein [Desulfovibrionales bacterium]
MHLLSGLILIRRANPPSQNMWAIPGGKIKLGETLQQAAEREVLEETGIVVRA